MSRENLMVLGNVQLCGDVYLSGCKNSKSYERVKTIDIPLVAIPATNNSSELVWYTPICQAIEACARFIGN